MNQFIFLILLIILAIGLPLFFNLSGYIEGYTNYTLEKAMGELPDAETKILVQDTYQPTGKNEITNNSASDIWQEYPTFSLGSYEQTTNNIRYPKNPDIGKCTPASMCGAFYNNTNVGDNIIKPLPQLKPDCGRRVGYFDTGVNLMTFRTNSQNILY